MSDAINLHPVELGPSQRACLIDLARGPLRLFTGWSRDGERKMRFFYARAVEGPRDEHIGRTILSLGAKGFCETGPDYDDFIITDAGRAWLKSNGLG